MNGHYINRQKPERIPVPESEYQSIENFGPSPRKFPTMYIAFGAFGALSLLLHFLSFAYLYKLANQPQPTLVQTLDGRSIQVTSQGSNDRTPEAIKSYTYRVLTQLFAATGVIPDNQGRLVEDRQFTVDGRPITTGAWAASHALSSDFPRPAMLEGIADITPSQVFEDERQTEVHLEILNLSEPKPVGEGAWQVDVVATRTVIQQGMETDRFPFNKSVFIRAIEPYQLPETPTATHLAMFEYRGGGMEVYAIDGLRLSPVVHQEGE